MIWPLKLTIILFKSLIFTGNHSPRAIFGLRIGFPHFHGFRGYSRLLSDERILIDLAIKPMKRIFLREKPSRLKNFLITQS
jgi:hypothetical protein